MEPLVVVMVVVQVEEQAVIEQYLVQVLRLQQEHLFQLQSVVVEQQEVFQLLIHHLVQVLHKQHKVLILYLAQ